MRRPANCFPALPRHFSPPRRRKPPSDAPPISPPFLPPPPFRPPSPASPASNCRSPSVASLPIASPPATVPAMRQFVLFERRSGAIDTPPPPPRPHPPQFLLLSMP